MSFVELKKALNEESIRLDGIDSKLWNRLSIPNASESKNSQPYVLGPTQTIG